MLNELKVRQLMNSQERQMGAAREPLRTKLPIEKTLRLMAVH